MINSEADRQASKDRQVGGSKLERKPQGEAEPGQPKEEGHAAKGNEPRTSQQLAVSERSAFARLCGQMLQF